MLKRGCVSVALAEGRMFLCRPSCQANHAALLLVDHPGSIKVSLGCWPTAFSAAYGAWGRYAARARCVVRRVNGG